jgi:hypothetical protein
MKIKPALLAGVLLVLGGIFTLVHPHFSRVVQRDSVTVGSMHSIIETTRIITVPRYLSAMLIFAGAILAFLSRISPSGPPRSAVRRRQ